MPIITKLTHGLFGDELIDQLDQVLRHEQYGVGLPTATDLKTFEERYAVVPWLPYIGNFRSMCLEEHRDYSFPMCEFLKKLLGQDSTLNMGWIEEFRALVFDKNVESEGYEWSDDFYSEDEDDDSQNASN